jgi:hypothetical protein
VDAAGLQVQELILRPAVLIDGTDFGEKYAFNPGGPEQWLSYFFIAAGWTLATTVAAGAARVLRRG